MRHHDRNKKLNRTTNQRGALLRTLAVALIERGSIKTTEAKAKALRPFVERLVTNAKPGTLAARRIILSRLDNNLKITKKLVEEIAVTNKDRAGGYVRIIKLPARKSDGSRMAQISFV